MAEIVATLGVPHTPAFPALVARDGPDCETARLYAAQRRYIEQTRPDLLVMFTTDHLNTFFFDNLPVFAAGVADRFTGPNDEVPNLPLREVRSNAAFASHLHRHAVESDFDMSRVENFSADHSVLVPLHFLTPGMAIPVVPVFVSGHVPPLPSAARCYELGRAVRRAIESWDEDLRVAVIGSGSFSLDVYGPRIEIGQSFGVPDPLWASRVDDLLRSGRTETLIGEATPAQMSKAGNVGGELLNWVAMLGASGARKPDWLTLQPAFGHGYGVWLN
jgi:hypothetical protein